MSNIQIQELQPIKVSGLSNKVKIVGADYQVGSMKQSARVSLSMIDKESILPSVPLSVTSPVQIQIGGIKFTGYPISETRTCSPSGDNVITVEFVDGSFILDKILVGLWGKHYQANPKMITVGDSTFKNWSRGSFYGADPFVIVGDFVDPCGDDELDVKIDPCDICEDTPLELVREYEAQMRKIDCARLRDLRILNVEYSFLDLIQAVNSGWPPVRINSAPYTQGATEFKRDYTGTLREVLNNWCRDFGWMHYWEDGQIKFVDLRAGISVNLRGLDSDCNVASITTSRSLEGTYSNSVIGYFGREGQDRDYKCNYQFGKRIVCRPLNLKDLLSPTQPMAKFASAYVGVNGTSPQEWTVDKYDLTEFLCMCSMYSPRIREAVTWLNVYGIVSAEAAKNRVELSQSVTGIAGISIPYTCFLESEIGEDESKMRHTLPLLDMTIKKVFSSQINPSAYDLIKETVGGEVKELIDANPDDYYFFFGSRSDEKFSTRFEWEAAIGSEFLGKFFIRKFSSITGNAPSIAAAGGDSARYYEQGDAGLDFSRLFVTQNPESYISELTNEDGESTDAFIFVERNPIWVPTPNQGDSLETLIQICDEVIPQEVTGVLSLGIDLSGPELKNDHEDADATVNGGWTDFDTLFFVKKYKASKNSGALTISNLETYDFHPKDKIKEIDIDGYVTPVKVGLRSTQAKKIFIENIIFWMPPQSTVREQESDSESEHIPYAGGYYVFVNNNISKETSLILPKIEIIQSHPISISSNTLTNNLVGASLSERDLEEYSYDEVTLKCSPNVQVIEDALSDYVSPIRINHTKPTEEVSIEYNGIPSQSFSIEDGFKSMSIRYYADAPVCNLSFGTSNPVPIDPSVRLEINSNTPIFFGQQTRRGWRKPPKDYPKEGGYPTL